MSHFKERAEKICLNCNAEVVGRYCHVCGQENKEPKETVWHLVTHFFSDITHFDGKFFTTTGYLVSRPGFLPKEYIKGRRASWINPIRMYIFSSAIFFIIFFSMFEPKNMVGGSDLKSKAMDSVQVSMAAAKKKALAEADTKEDSAAIEKAFSYATLTPIVKPNTSAAKDTLSKKDSVAKKVSRVKSKNRGNWNFSIINTEFKSRKAYDSAQAALPENERDGWLRRKVTYRNMDLSEKYKEDEMKLWMDLIEKFFHSFPYLLFVSLPLYALYLKLLYIRRKKFYYVDHGIFLIYLYIFTFIYLLVFFGLNELPEKWGFIEVLQIILFLYGIYYTFRAMRKFYEQRWWKTFFKFMILNFLSLISLIFLFVLFFILTIFRV